MKLQQQIKEQMIEAMKSKDDLRLQTLRSLVSAFTNELVALKRTPQSELSDEEVLNVIKRAVKQRKDSIEQFQKGGRKDLAENEKAELLILEKYLPEMMSKEEIVKVAEAKKIKMGIENKSKSGVLMGALMKELKDKADGDIVKSVVDELLK
jgi:uncharacterized protein YqeY